MNTNKLHPLLLLLLAASPVYSLVTIFPGESTDPNAGAETVVELPAQPNSDEQPTT